MTTVLLLLTTRPSRQELRGRPVLLPLAQLDHVEQRDGHAYVRTAAGADLYVTQTTDEILDQILELANPTQEAR